MEFSAAGFKFHFGIHWHIF